MERKELLKDNFTAILNNILETLIQAKVSGKENINTEKRLVNSTREGIKE